MIKAIIFDFSRVLLFPKDNNYSESLNDKYKLLISDKNYNFFDHFKLNTELLDFIKELKNKTNVYLFTSETIQDAKELKPYTSSVFNDVFSASKLGISKKDQTSYQVIAKEIKIPINEIVFIDDSLDNIEAANKAGMQTIQYVNNDKLITQIYTLL